MIHSARPTVSPVVIIVFTWNLFCFEKWGRADGRTLCENSDHYRPRLWVGLVDQYNFNIFSNLLIIHTHIVLVTH